MIFNTCLILLKSIEPVVKNAIDVWSDVYKLQKPSEEIVEINDDDNDGDEEDMDGGNTISMDVTDEDLEQLAREKEEEEMKEEEVEEEDDPKNIAAAIIASLPQSPPKTTKSTVEIGSSSKIVSITETSIAQSPPGTS